MSRPTSSRATTSAANLSHSIAEAETKALAKGLAEGQAKGEARALLAVLGARGIPVPDQARQRIIGCTDPDQLETWVCRAATAKSVDDLFASS